MNHAGYGLGDNFVRREEEVDAGSNNNNKTKREWNESVSNGEATESKWIGSQLGVL
jgi:hypothetical protein